jgi:hypothetical protein
MNLDLTFEIFVEEKEGVDRGDDFGGFPKTVEMISEGVQGSQRNAHMKVVKRVLESKVVVKDVSDEKGEHKRSLQEHETHCYGIPDGMSL